MITIRCDVGKNIGIGHYSRCTLLKKAFEENGIKATLAVRFLDSEASQLPADCIVTGNILNEHQLHESPNVIFDLLHNSFRSKDLLQSYFQQFNKESQRLFVIEGLYDESCPSEVYRFIDGLFTPYITENTMAKMPNHFFGKNYVMLDSSRVIEFKEIKQKAQNILLTFGGSDPYSQTLKTLDVIKSDSRLNNKCYRAVIGPLMSKNQIDLISGMAQFLSLELIHSPHDLRDCFDWADVAITNTGQTRYELAASGVPFIILPFDEVGYSKSSIFEQMGIAYLLQPLNEINESDLKNKIYDLLENALKRKNMSEFGKTNVSSRSIDNFATKVITLCQTIK